MTIRSALAALVFATAATSPSTWVHSELAAQTRSHMSYFEVRRGLFAMSKVQAAPIVMAGDSLIEAGTWNELTGCAGIANRGIGGDTSKRLLDRFDDVLTLKPRAVFVMVGVNDLTLGVARDATLDSLRTIFARLARADAHVFMHYVLPVAASYPKKSINKEIPPLNAAIAKLVADQPTITTIDARPQLMGPDGFMREEFAYDGLHLTPTGYAVLRDLIAPHVAKYCGG
jgi:lysophospholipase L1-like esterase